jgi:hypothetical protein
MAIQVSGPTIEVNDEVIAYESNTAKYTEGKGEKKVRAANVGGGVTEPITSQDISTKIAKVMFSLPTTIKGISLTNDWATANGTLVVKYYESNADGNFSRVIQNATMVNDPEKDTSVDGVIEVEIHGTPAI